MRKNHTNRNQSDHTLNVQVALDTDMSNVSNGVQMADFKLLSTPGINFKLLYLGIDIRD